MKKVLDVAACGMFVLTSFSISGCATQSESQSASYRPTITAAPDASAHLLGTLAPTPVPNDLVTGSVQRTLTAGPVDATVDYTSDLAMDRWTAGAMKPISVEITTTMAPDDGRMVYLESVSLVATPYDGDVAMTSLAKQVDDADVDPGYLILPPDSYTQTFDVEALPARADRVVVEVHYDFLVQSASESFEFAKQTVSDRLTVAIAPSAE